MKALSFMQPSTLRSTVRAIDEIQRMQRPEDVDGEVFCFEFAFDQADYPGPKRSQFGFANGGCKYGEEAAGVGDQQTLAPVEVEEIRVPVLWVGRDLSQRPGFAPSSWSSLAVQRRIMVLIRRRGGTR